MKKPYISLIHKAFCLFSRFPFLGLGAENGTRTRDLNLGKVALYQLSYFRNMYPNSCFGTANINRIFDSAKFFTTFPETKHPDRTTIGVFVEYWLTVRFNEP